MSSKGRLTADLVVVGASELVTCAGRAPAAGSDQSRVAVIENGAVAARNGEVIWTGPQSLLKERVELSSDAQRIDVNGGCVLPGLVDPHTHLVWSGSRADEFEKRLAGATYSEIAAQGGGILRTVEATRGADLPTLTQLAASRVQRLARGGVTSVEVKSGYGLEAEAELRQLTAARRAGERLPIQLVTTFLGAHTFPASARESSSQREKYVDLICHEMIPQVAEQQLARFADVFVDEHAFSLEQARRVLSAARDHGLAVKVHADQLADDGAAQLAAEMGATSADHLEHASRHGLKALAAAGVVAVLIPAASLFLRMKQHADARRMIELGLPVALATDLNPGTCPCDSMTLVMQLGCLLCGLTIDEAIVAATLNAAAAAGLSESCGSIEPGKRCDLLVLSTADRRELIYRFGSAPIAQVIANGQPLNR